MIYVRRIARSLRYNLRDTWKNKISDYELLDAINTALDALYAECAELGVRATQKSDVLDLENGVTQLPYDYSSMVDAWAGEEENEINHLISATSPDEDLKYAYFVSGGELRTSPDETKVLVRYHAMPPEVADLDTILDLPGSMALPLKYMALASMQMELEKLIGLARNAAGRLAESAWGELPDKAGLI